jgi:hypothetical protein
MGISFAIIATSFVVAGVIKGEDIRRWTSRKNVILH